MSRNLARLLGKEQAEVIKALTKLEERSGFPSEDVRLLAENKHKLRAKIQQLGLDSDDTTDEELYHALQARYVRDSQMLDKALGVTTLTKFDERLNKAIQLVNHCASTDEMWVIKNSVTKSALVKNPHKHVAKKLRYRSVASMLKREDIAEVYLAGLIIESAAWQKNISKYMAKLNGSHYELRPIKIVTLRSADWGDIKGPASHLVFDNHIGALAVWPSTNLWDASVLCLTLFLLEGIQSLNPPGYAEVLHELSPALRFWADAQYLISDGESPVSLNLKDVAFNHLRNLELKEAARRHGARTLWQELTARYQKISQSLLDIPDIQYNFTRKVSTRLPTTAELAEEYAPAE
jgi:hypothetical protein